MARVTVIGGGVIGLTSALTLARAGHQVRCVRDQSVHDTVSRIAGGLWFPYHAEPRELVARWASLTLRRFRELATDSATGVRLAEGLLVHRTPPDRWWATDLDWRPARPDELPPGALGGTVTTVPLVDTSVFLPWLEQVCHAAAVEFVSATVTTLDIGGADSGSDADTEVVVVAGGLRSGELTGDRQLTPGRGQVVRLANPGLQRWIVDGERPDGLAYVFPHPGWVVCGGTDIEGVWDTEPSPQTEAAILARCRALVPALAHAPVLSRAVGLRPLAPEVRLARHTDSAGRTIVTNYGHGGSGITLCWGCADDVAALLAGD
jgi:D-amino-acid oxidase